MGIKNKFSYMKTLQESIINERISYREFKDIQGYVKSWITKCSAYTDYLDVVSAMINGIEEGIKDNKKYYTDDYRDGKPMKDTNEFYLDIQQPLHDLREVSIKNAKRN